MHAMKPIAVPTRVIAAFTAALLAGLSGVGQAAAVTQHPARAAVPGGIAWTSLYSPATGGIGSGATIAVSPSGNAVFAVGNGQAGEGTSFATVAYNTNTGAQMWASQYRGPGQFSMPRAVTISPDGSTVFVTGSSEGNVTNRDYATVAYNAATGRQLWVRRYNGPGSQGDDPAAIVAAPDGKTVYVTGTSQGSGTRVDYATIELRRRHRKAALAQPLQQLSEKRRRRGIRAGGQP